MIAAIPVMAARSLAAILRTRPLGLTSVPGSGMAPDTVTRRTPLSLASSSR